MNHNQVNFLSPKALRKNSFDSYSSTNGSHVFRSTDDFDPISGQQKSHKFKELHESKIRKSVRKINNLKFLGFLKAKDNTLDGRNDAEMFKKIFKVTQKGLNFNNQQYFLSLNASIINNHLIRQASPIERLKVNLYDDERTLQNQNLVNVASINNLMPNGVDTSTNGNQQSLTAQTNNQQNKKPAFRRRNSCYCNQTGKQSLKAQRIDYLITTSFIKNQIFLRMKKKQDIKSKNMNEKDLIIQNLNRTFDLQEKNTGQSGKNSPNFQQSHQQDQTPQTNKIIVNSPKQKKQNIQTQQQLASKSQFSHINSPQNEQKQLSANNMEVEEQINKNSVNINKEITSPIEFNKRSLQKKQTFSQTVDQFKDDQAPKTPLLHVNQKKEDRFRTHDRQKSNISNASSIKGKGENEFVLSRTISKKNHSSSKNSPKNSIGTASPRRTQNVFKSNLFFNNHNVSNSFFNNYLSAGKGKEEQQEGTYLQQYQQLYPAFNEKRRKLLAKLRMASKLVGIQEKQRKKSLLFHQDYYNALQDIANNVAEQDHKVDQDDNNTQNEEKKTNFVKKVKNDQKNIRSPFMVHQIIDAHNLRFNSTLNSFIDQRSKSHNTLISPSANTMSSINTNQKKNKQINPFSHDNYLQPVLPFTSPSQGSSVNKRIVEKSPLLLFQTQANTINGNEYKNFHQMDKPNGSQDQNKRINLSIDMNHKKNSKSMMGFTSSKFNGISNSQPSLDDIQVDQSKQSLGLISPNAGMHNPQQPQKSFNDIQSLNQLGKLDTFNPKTMKMNQTATTFKPQSKAQQKFETLLNSQVASKNSYFFKNPNPMKNTQLLSTNKGMNTSKINFRNNSQPELLQQAKFDNSHNISIASSNITQHKQMQSQQSTRPNYISAKFETKARKSVKGYLS